MSARDALMIALIPPSEDGSIPGVDRSELRRFWFHFDRSAPFLVRIGVGLAAFVVVIVGPRLWGPGGPWSALDDEARDHVLARCAATPGLSELLEVAKLAAAFLWGDQVDAQAAVRRPGDPARPEDP